MTTSIKIFKKFLAFRDEIKPIQKKINKLELADIRLDFSATDFISRSFADELLNLLEDLKKRNRHVKLVALKSQVKKMLRIVKETKVKIRKELARV